MNEFITWLESIERMITDLQTLIEASKIFAIVTVVLLAILLFCVIALLYNVNRVNKRVDQIYDIVDQQDIDLQSIKNLVWGVKKGNVKYME